MIERDEFDVMVDSVDHYPPGYVMRRIRPILNRIVLLIILQLSVVVVVVAVRMMLLRYFYHEHDISVTKPF